MQAKSTANIYINGVAADATLKSLRAEAAKLRNELANLSPTSEDFAKKAERFREVDGRIQGLNGNLKQTKGLFGQLQTELGKFGTMAVAYLGFEAVTGQLGNLIRKNAELSDSLADVMKTTGMTEVEAQKLNSTLGDFDTRTARKELLALARDAGKLGITGKKEVEEFVRAADKINVALGEDLGKDAITQIGKLVSLFRLKEQFGLEQSMLKVASAMNTLGASSEASEGYITDFLSRMGGIAPMANISIDQVMALGATLDSLGQTSEVSSTALSKMFTKMASDAATYARIAGVSTAEFRQMMNDNALGAFMMVLEAAGKTEGGLVQLTETLGDLGVEGGRATGVFGVLAKNTDLLKKQMDIAKKSFQDGTSVLDEFNTKNTNLAANVEKLQKHFGGLFTSGMLARGIKNAINYLASFIEPGETAIQTTQKLTTEINGQLNVLRTANLNNTQRKKLIDEINTAYGEYLPRLLSEKDTTADIVQLQQQFNSNMATKMNMMRYEEEMALILKRQQAAAEMLYNIEVKRAKMGSENLDAKTFATITSQLMAQEALAKAVLDGTDDQIEALKKKFINIQQFMGQSPAIPGNASQSTDAGAAAGGTTSSFKTREDELKKFYELDLLLLKQSLANKSITKEEYDLKATELEFKHLNDRIAAAKLYNEESVKLELELEEFKLKQMEIDAQREQETKKQAFEQIKNGIAEEEALIHQNYADGLISEEQYQQQLQELVIGGLEMLKIAHQAYGDDVTEIERKIAEAKAGFEKKKQKSATETVDHQKKLNEEIKLAEMQLTLARQENLTDLLSATKGFLKEGSALHKIAFAATKASAIAEVIIRAQIEKAAITARNSFFPGGEALSTLQRQRTNARMSTSIALIAAQSIQELVGFDKGGYTGAGYGSPDKSGFKVAGVVHADEYVTPSWMLRDPVYANVASWLEDKRVSRTPGYEAIKESSTSTVNNLMSTTDMSRTNQLLEQVLIALQHKEETQVVIGDDKLWELRERIMKLEKAEQNARFS